MRGAHLLLLAVAALSLLACASAVKPGRRLLIEEEPARKNEWPDLVGLSASDATALLKAEGVETIRVVPQGSMVTMDFNPERVRLFVDESQKVVAVPRRG